MNTNHTVKLLIASMLFAAVGCTNKQDTKALEEKARIEGREQAIGELEVQIKAKDQMIEKARTEAKIQVEEEYKAQLANQAMLVEKARLEGKAQAEEQIKAENNQLSTKAQAMEKDLATRHRFYQAAAGTYQGTLSTTMGEFNIRITLVPSLPPYVVDRVRQLEEITSDLNNLYFNAQIIQWSPGDNLSSVGCRIEGVRPDLANGTISIASSNCPNVYMLAISSEKTPPAKPNPKGVAGSVLSGSLKTVVSLMGEVRPTTNAAVYKVFAKKSEK